MLLIMNQKLVLSRYRFCAHFVRCLATSGRRFSANYTNITNKTQITTTYGSSKVQTITKPNPPKYISLRHCSPIPSMTIMDSMVESLPITTTRRPLTLIFAWMLAKDKHIEKYRQLWFKMGFDVLTVKTSPLDLLFPPIGGRVVAMNLVKYLSDISSQYNEIVVHAFSVGGYQYGETLNGLKSNEDNKDILNSIKGVVLDSIVYTEDCAPGLSRAITLNPIIQPMIESSIYLFLKLFNNISVKNYLKASDAMFNPVVRYPGLILYSKDDIVSNVGLNEKLVQTWKQRGNTVTSKCWSKSTHVQHYRDHQLEYEQELETFIKSLKLRNCKL